MDSQARNAQIRVQFVSEWKQLLSCNIISLRTFVSECPTCPVSCAPLLGEVSFVEGGSPALSWVCQASHLHLQPASEKNGDDFFFWSTHRKSLDGDIWKWGQEGLFSAGLGTHSPFWKAACWWKEVQDKQEPPKQ